MEEQLEGMVEARQSLGSCGCWWVDASEGVGMELQGCVFGWGCAVEGDGLSKMSGC